MQEELIYGNFFLLIFQTQVLISVFSFDRFIWNLELDIS